jgi:hypothetical protein
LGGDQPIFYKVFFPQKYLQELCQHTRAGVGLKSAGSGLAWALHCGLGLLWAWPGLGGGLGVWPAGLAQKPDPCGLGPGPAPALQHTCSRSKISLVETYPFQIVHFELPHFFCRVSELLDYTSEELTGQSLYALCHGEDVHKLRRTHEDRKFAQP